MTVKKILIVCAIVLLVYGLNHMSNQEVWESVENTPNIPNKKVLVRLHWFIPDGMRADPETFNIYRWAMDGELPNIKRLMENGAYGFSKPVFPSHTPVNYATLLTGTIPKTHGVADGPMRLEGNTLAAPSISGFSSRARKVPAIWKYLEDDGYNVFLISVPGSTPPELEKGTTIRGRWGGWGADFHSIIIERKDPKRVKEMGRSTQLFYLGGYLTQFVDGVKKDTINESSSKPISFRAEVYGDKIEGKVIDSTDDKKIDYDRVILMRNGSEICNLGAGEWSEWVPAVFKWQDIDIHSHMRFNIIKLNADGFFRIRVLVSNINDKIVMPPEIAELTVKNAGPMVDFVDNYPPQLIYFNEDKKTFLEEANMSFDWHISAINYYCKSQKPDAVIHSIYTPNQMLTSRWWLGYIDNQSRRYDDVDEVEREKLWLEVKDMYKRLDEMIGEAMEDVGENGVFVLSSDHGAYPLDVSINLNNYFFEKGWINASFDNTTGNAIINWNKTRVIYLKMDNVYVNPDGLGDMWKRGEGEDYESFRQEVMNSLLNLNDSRGIKPIVAAVKNEDVEDYLDLPPSRVGDIVIANKPGYGFNEEMTQEGKIFSIPLKTGYKQAIFSDNVSAMWTPFMISGPGVKKNYMINHTISMEDQFPTIMYVLGLDVPKNIDGTIISEIIE
ncbi:MAG: alkaline phosphatase family protein [Candidatus Altiarchaeota archaeon]|nr:alkaline phosphatase family protein [Candidatus Altiarchaeota archaeon]